MRIASVLRVFAAGCVVYFVMAACASERSSTNSSTGSSAGGTSSASSSNGGTSGSAGTSGLLNPVPDAKAAETASESCNKTYQNGAATIYYAEHTYPGVSAADLATSVAYLVDKGASPAPSGYDKVWVLGGFVRDGAVAVTCTQNSSVTFVRR